MMTPEQNKIVEELARKCADAMTGVEEMAARSNSNFYNPGIQKLAVEQIQHTFTPLLEKLFAVAGASSDLLMYCDITGLRCSRNSRYNCTCNHCALFSALSALDTFLKKGKE